MFCLAQEYWPSLSTQACVSFHSAPTCVRRLGLSSRRLASDPARARLHQPRKLLQTLVPEEVILVRCGDYSARKGVFAYERPGKTVIVTCVDAACSGEESVVQTSKAMKRNLETSKSDICQFFRSAARLRIGLMRWSTDAPRVRLLGPARAPEAATFEVLDYLLAHVSPGCRWLPRGHWLGHGCGQACGCCRSHNVEDAEEGCNCQPCYTGWILTTVDTSTRAAVAQYVTDQYGGGGGGGGGSSGSTAARR